MAKNTIGQFIAALRKANGLTQQDVADRLNVSNKAVSRWERDECAPDLSVIPALAEMFGVSCDELLKGERILETSVMEKKEPRVEKQVRNLVNRTLSGFKTLIWISLAVAVVGLVCMFGISYGFYRPVIGFAVMLLFEACALAIAILAVSRTKDVKTDNELFEIADSSLLTKFNNVLGAMSFHAFFVIFAAVLISLPLVLFTSDYVNSVMTPYSYFNGFFGYIALILVFVYLKCKQTYIIWITGGKIPAKENGLGEKTKRQMTNLQLSMSFAAGLLFILAPYLETNHTGKFSFYDVAIILALALILANIICFIIYLAKNKHCRKELALPGARNALTVIPLFLLTHVHTVSWGYIGEMVVGSAGDGTIQAERYERYDNWHTEFIWLTIGVVLALFLVFGIIDLIVKRKAKTS